MIDIGGGTTEISYPTGEAISLPLGTTSVIHAAAELEMPTPPEVLLALRQRCRQMISGHSLPPSQSGPVVGLGSTFKALLRMTKCSAAVSRGVITGTDIIEAVTRLAALGSAERRAVPGVSPKRMDILVPGGIIAEEVLRAMGVSDIDVLNTSTAYGILPWLRLTATSGAFQ